MTWYNEFVKAKFNNLTKSNIWQRKNCGNNRVIFNIKGNDFRLIASVNFTRLAAYIIWFGTHNEYDKINAITIEFDTEILNAKQSKHEHKSNKNTG